MSNVLQTYNSLNPIAELSKSDLVQLSEKQIEEIIEAGSSEQAYAFLHKVETLCKLVKDGIVSSAIEEIEKGNDFAFGIKMKAQQRTTLSFKNSVIWNRLNDEISIHEAFLKGLKHEITEVDTDTGELIKHEPPVKKVSFFVKTEF